jgi:hypothetical protein
MSTSVDTHLPNQAPSHCSHRERRLRLRIDRERKKLCVRCGKSPMAVGKVHCEACRQRHAKSTADAQRKRISQGICLDFRCKERPAADHTLCARHLEAMRLATNARRQERIKRGICIDSCGRRVEFPDQHQRCFACESRLRKSDSLPRFVRKMIKDGLRRYRIQEAQEFLRSYLRLVGQREQKVLALVYGLADGKLRSLVDTAREMGFSRERARQIHDKGMLRIFAVPAEPPTFLVPIRERLQKYPERLHERLRARRITRQAVDAGRLLRQPCRKCGAAKADAHHTDYSKPLDVDWLCGPCHKRVHRADRAA